MTQPQIVLIAALSRNRVIGKNNSLPWRLPGDMLFFKQTTLGHAVLMGRKTWQSLPKPLSERLNLILSRDHNFDATGGQVVSTLEAALELAARYASNKPLFVIGGSQAYELALPRAKRLILTEVDAEIDGDAFFPEFSRRQWQEVSRRSYTHDEANTFNYDIVEYEPLHQSSCPDEQIS